MSKVALSALRRRNCADAADAHTVNHGVARWVEVAQGPRSAASHDSSASHNGIDATTSERIVAQFRIVGRMIGGLIDKLEDGGGTRNGSPFVAGSW
jgi:hypothetical protein